VAMHDAVQSNMDLRPSMRHTAEELQILDRIILVSLIARPSLTRSVEPKHRVSREEIRSEK